jgi:hypothetical protein
MSPPQSESWRVRAEKIMNTREFFLEKKKFGKILQGFSV